MEECPGDTLCCDVHQRNGFWPTREPVDASAEVSIALGRRQRPDKVDVDHVETVVRSRKGGQWRGDVPVHLGSLTPEAGSSPPADIRIDTRPDVSCSEQLLRGASTRMGQSMEGVENTAPKTLRYERPRTACRCVANESSICCGQWNGLEGEGSRTWLETNELQVILLGKCHGMEIDGV